MGDLRLVYLDPAQLAENPANWRTHSADQRDAVRAAIGEVGWVKPLIYNERTKRLVDGHLRRELFAGQLAPVVIGDWDEPTEAKVLATLDPLGALAEVNAAAFDSLLRQIDTGSEDLQSLLAAVAESAGLYAEAGQLEHDADGKELPDLDAAAATEEQGPAPPVAEEDVVPATIWPSSNADGVPDLDPDMQADHLPFPLVVWGSQSRSKPMAGTWSFYTADRRFEPLWRDPTGVLKSGAKAVVEPNFSTHDQFPRAVVAWQVYRKRWLGRYWQSRGLRLFVDLNVEPAFQAINLLGVPKGWRAYATRSHSDGAYLEHEWEVAKEHSGSDRPLFVVYGGGEAAKALATKHGWTWVPEQSELARDKRFGAGLRRSVRKQKG